MENINSVCLLGAGASRGYDSSPTGVCPPLAKGLLAAYLELPISGDIEVKVGNLVGYVRDRYGIAPADYSEFDMDAEQFMTELRQSIEIERDLFLAEPTIERDIGLMALGAAYTQTVFVFAHILNEICNGPVSRDYVDLLKRVDANATLVTFNWDILLDRALEETTGWTPDSGYGLTFDRVMDDGWREQRLPSSVAAPGLLKLHGSTNWFARWFSFGRGGQLLTMIADKSTRAITMSAEAYYEEQPLKGKLPAIDPLSVKYKMLLDANAGQHKTVPAEPHLIEPCLFISGAKHFDTWRDRWRADYQRFTYFYPPNLPEGIPTLPLIVAPTREKEYKLFGNFLESLWASAAAKLAASNRLEIIGYSFPKTDLRARDLVRGFAGRVTVVNPAPEPVRDALLESGIAQENISIFQGTLREYNAR